MNVEQYEHAMDMLMVELRTNERDDWYDAETEEYERRMHEPSAPMGGSDHERP